MKKIELVKEYQGKKPGHKVELRIGRADYLIRMGIARELNEKDKNKPVSKPKVTKGKAKTKVTKPAKEKK